jgi:hypothetical protein
MIAEDSFHLIVEECRITTLILQLHLDITPELVVLGEHRYDRN